MGEEAFAPGLERLGIMQAKALDIPARSKRWRGKIRAASG
jgi:hypothetical protein